LNIPFFIFEGLTLVVVPAIIAVGLRLIVKDVRSTEEQKRVESEKVKAQQRAIFEGRFEVVEQSPHARESILSRRWSRLIQQQHGDPLGVVEIPLSPAKVYWESGGWEPTSWREPRDRLPPKSQWRQ